MNNSDDFFYGKKVIITGASGFIGSHLSRELMYKGAKVYAFVRKQSDLWRLKSIFGKIEIIEVDLLNFKNTHKLIDKIRPNYIFHFAIPSHTLLRDALDLRRQIDITNGHLINLFQSIELSNIKLNGFIHACSGSVYEWNKHHFVLTESTPLQPSTLRGMLKLSQRNLCLYLSKNDNIPIKLARIFRAYGPWETPSKLIVKALDSERLKTPILLGNDEYKRDYIFIKDLIDGILALTKSNMPSGTEMNFGSNFQYNPSEIVTKIEQILGNEIPKSLNTYPKNLYDKGDFIADCSLAKKKLGWLPTTEIEKGLKATISWYKNQYQ